jgi:hypothetical protein
MARVRFVTSVGKRHETLHRADCGKLNPILRLSAAAAMQFARRAEAGSSKHRVCGCVEQEVAEMKEGEA